MNIKYHSAFRTSKGTRARHIFLLARTFFQSFLFRNPLGATSRNLCDTPPHSPVAYTQCNSLHTIPSARRVCIPARSSVHPRYLQHARFAHARRRLGNVGTMGKASPCPPRERPTRDTIVRLLDRGFFPAFQPGVRAVPPPPPLFSLAPGANATSPGVNRTIQSFKVKHNAIIRRAPTYILYGFPQQYMLYVCMLLI